MSVVISKQADITRIATHIDTLSIGNRTDKIHDDILLQNLETANKNLFNIVSARDTNEHDRRFAGSLMVDYHSRIAELRKNKTSKTIEFLGKLGLGAVASLAVGLFTGVW